MAFMSDFESERNNSKRESKNFNRILETFQEIMGPETNDYILIMF